VSSTIFAAQSDWINSRRLATRNSGIARIGGFPIANAPLATLAFPV
jgi:hypothetical protein